MMMMMMMMMMMSDAAAMVHAAVVLFCWMWMSLWCQHCLTVQDVIEDMSKFVWMGLFMSNSNFFISSSFPCTKDNESDDTWAKMKVEAGQSFSQGQVSASIFQLKRWGLLFQKHVFQILFFFNFSVIWGQTIQQNLATSGNWISCWGDNHQRKRPSGVL